MPNARLLPGHVREQRGKLSPEERFLEYAHNRLMARGIVRALTAQGL